MDAFPAFIPLSGRRVVVIGDGEAADAKARLFAGSPAVLVRAPKATPDEMEGAALVFIALAEGPDLAAAVAAARAAGALINVVDRPDLSDFTTPSIVDRGPVVGAIGTDGAAPVLATRLRQQLEAAWPERLGDLARLLKTRQAAIRERFPDLTDRRRFLRRLLDSDVAGRALSGDVDGAQALLTQAIAEAGVRSPGRIWRLAVGETPDDLTLADLRQLGAADRIVVSDGVPAAVLAFARRDAPRVASASPTELSAWVAAGEVICQLFRRDGSLKAPPIPPGRRSGRFRGR